MPLRIKKGSTTRARAESSEVQTGEMQSEALLHSKPDLKSRKDSVDRSESNLVESPLQSLPVELFLQITHDLCPREIVNLQLSCKTLYHIVSVQEEALVSMSLRNYPNIRLALEVYSCTTLPRVLPRLKDLIALTHRVNVVEKLVRFLITDILNEAYGHDIAVWAQQPTRWNTYQDAIQDVEPYFLLLGHFLEAFRANFVYLMTRGFNWDSRDAIASLLSSWTLRHYHPYASVRVCLVYRDLMDKLARRLRPPSYANAAERGLRGWTRDPAKPEECRDIAVFGGLESVYSIMCTPSYRHRMRAMDRCLSEQTGRLGKGKHYTMAAPTMPPLTRNMAKSLHAHLLSRNSPLLAHNNALLQNLTGVPSIEADPSDDPVHYNAGFGCRVFTAGYDPEANPFAEVEGAEGAEGVSLIVNPPRQGDPNPDFARQVAVLSECLPKAAERGSPSASGGDIERS